MSDVIIPVLGEAIPWFVVLGGCYLLAKADLRWDIGGRILRALMAYDEHETRRWHALTRSKR